MLTLQALFGIVVLVGLAWVFSENRRNVPWKTVISGIALQVILALLLLKLAWARDLFLALNRIVVTIQDASTTGVGLVWKIHVIDLVRFWCRDGRPKTAIRDNGPLQGRILLRRQGRAGEGGNAPHRQKRYDAVS